MFAIPGAGHHFKRLQFELGKTLKVGQRDFRVRGYLPNNLTTNDLHEAHLLNPLRRALFGRAGAFVDVGVNTGQTLLKLLSIDPNREYVGIEPQVACCFYITQFIRDNGLSNCRIIPVALGDRTAMLPLYSSNPADQMATIVPRVTARHGQAVSETFVAVRNGDEVLQEIGVEKPAVIKVDVEGAELDVFRSLSRTIARARPVCFFEVLANYTGHDRTPVSADLARENNDMAEGLLKLFDSLGYGIFQVHEDGSEMPINGFDLDNPATYVGRDYTAHPKPL